MKPSRSKTPFPIRRRSPAVRTLALVLAGLIAALPARVFAGPEGEEFVAGEVDVRRQGTTTHITASDGAIIEWQDFDIGVDETVEFIQPADWARVLNRVLSEDPTVIAGTLRANGQVYIAAPSGIYFEGTAIVDVARLIAVGGHISNEDFLAGVDRFELTAPVENRGVLQGDAIALLGTRVANHHQIVANDGLIMMAAGDSVWITEHGSPILIELTGAAGDAHATDTPEAPGVENSGTLDAGNGSVRLAAGDLLSVALRQNSRIRGANISVDGGASGLVDVRGVLDATAHGDDGEDGAGGVGGTIDITGDLIAVREATIDASGDAGGGRVRIGGDRHGRGPLRNARAVAIDRDVAVRADATREGDGGEVVVWSDEATFAHGEFTARGGEQGGDGGFIETSSKGFLSTGDIPADASAPNGNAGTWLLDPSDLRIVDDTSGQPGQNLDVAFDNLEDALSPNPVIFPSEDASVVSADRIEDALAGGTSVTLTTELFDSVGSAEGDVTFEASIEFGDREGNDATPGTTARLQVEAANDIRFEPGTKIDATGDGDDLTLNVSLFANGLGLVTGVRQPELEGQEEIGIVDLPATSEIHTAGGDLEIWGAEANPTDAMEVGKAGLNIQGTINTGGGDLTLVTDGGDIVVGSDAGTPSNSVSTEGGDLSILGLRSTDTQAGDVITVHGELQTEGGTLAVLGVGGSVDVDGLSSASTSDPGTSGGVFVEAGNALAPAVAGEGAPAGPFANAADAPLPDRSVTIDGPIDAGGGNVALARGGSDVSNLFSARLARIVPAVEAADTLTVADDIATGGGILDVGAVNAPTDIALEGQITTETGPVLIAGNSVTIADDIDTRPAGGGAFAEDEAPVIDIRTNDTIEIADGVGFFADTVRLAGAADGFVGEAPDTSGDLAAPAVRQTALTIGDGVSFSANEVELRAGDGYSAGAPAGGLASIEFGSGVSVTDSDGEVARFEVVQDAALDDASIPIVAPAADQQIVYESSDETLSLSRNVDSGTNLVLRARSSDPDGDAIEIAQDLTPETLVVETYEAMTVDAALGSRLQPSRTLEVRAGLASSLVPDAPQAPAEGDPTAQELAGTLRIEADLMVPDDMDPQTDETLVLHGGAGGPGALEIVDEGAGRTLTAGVVVLQAGDGRLGNDETATVSVDPTVVFANTEDLSVQQDAAIETMRDVPAVSGLSRLAVRSDDGDLSVNSALAADQIVLRAANTPTFDDGGSVAASQLEIGSLTGMQVTDELLAAIGLDQAAPTPSPYDELTFTSGEGDLDFGADQMLRADRIVLVSGFESTNNTPFEITDLSGVTLADKTGAAPPLEVDFVQKAQILSSNQIGTLSVFNFAGSEGDRASTTLRIRSELNDTDDNINEVSVTNYEDLVGTGGALRGLGTIEFHGRAVRVAKDENAAGDLDLIGDPADAPELVIRAEDARLTADCPDCGVIARDATTAVAIRPFEAQAVFLGDEESDPETVVQSLEVDQNRLLTAQSIPDLEDATGARSNDGVLVVLTAQSPESADQENPDPTIDLTDARTQLENTRLRLELELPETDTAETLQRQTVLFPDRSTPFELESLQVEAMETLRIEEASIDATPDGSDPAFENAIVFVGANSGLGDLEIGPNVDLTANRMEFGASVSTGTSPVFEVEDESTRPQIRFDSNVNLNFEVTEDAAGSLVVLQDGDLVHDPDAGGATPLPVNVNVTGATRIGSKTVESFLGDVEIFDPSALAADRTRVVAFGSTTSSVEITDRNGDLDIEEADIGSLTIQSPNITLRSINGIVDTTTGDGASAVDDDRLLIEDAFAFGIEQQGAFAATELPSIENFSFAQLGLANNGALPGTIYTLERTGAAMSGADIILDEALAERLVGARAILRAPETGQVSIETEIRSENELTSLFVSGPSADIPEDAEEAAAADLPGPRTVFAIPDTAGTGEPALIDVPIGLSFAGPVDLGDRDLRLEAQDVTFGNEIEAPNGTDLVIVATNNVVFDGDIGSETARLGSLDVRLDESQGFGPRVRFTEDEDDVDPMTDTAQEVWVRDFAGFRAMDSSDEAEPSELPGRSRPPLVATVSSQRDLTIDVETDTNDFQIQFGPDGDSAGGAEKISVPGALTLRAACGDAAGDACTGAVRLGDVSAQDFIVNAERLDIVRRAAGSVLNSGGSPENDAGTDLVANEYVFSRRRGTDPTDLLELTLSGRGQLPVFGVPNASAIQDFMEGLPTALLFANGRELVPEDFVRVVDDVETALDLRPRGGNLADLSEALEDRADPPQSLRPPQPRDRVDVSLDRVGIEARPATPREFEATLRGAGIYDDASVAWGAPRARRVAASRLDVDSAVRATELHREVLGESFENAEEIRIHLETAIRNYQRSTGATRVLGFELRRWLMNRPASQFEAFRTLTDLDELFAAHRRSGLARSEYERIQQAWLEAIQPDGISRSELAQAIHPTRYVRGSDILDIFGE